jgi:hypothetical protein
MSRRLTVVLFLFLISTVFIIAGCTEEMAISTKTKKIDLTQDSIVLMTAKISNEVSTSYQPTSCFVVINNVKTKKSKTFQVDKPYNSVKNQFKDYLISMKCVPGENKIQVINGFSEQILIYGNWEIPVNKSFNVESGKIVYLGRLEAVNKKRVSDDEVRAGRIIPLIDQAVSGFSGGTWHTKIYDNYEEDIATFKKEYPLLSNYTVEKVLLEKKK